PTNSGINRLFQFDDGTSLLDMVEAGQITTLDELIAQLKRLAGDSNVVNNGTSTEPTISLSLTKTLSGEADFDVAFDQFGGHVALSGAIEVSVDVHAALTFGFNLTDGFFVQTDGVDPELSFSNLRVSGDIEGQGQFGFLGAELENATLTVNGVTIAIDLTAPTGNKLGIIDLINPASLVSAAHVTITGPPGDDVVLTAALKATAMLPDQEEAFDLGNVGITIRWADIKQPTNVQVEFTGGIGDFLKVRAQQLASVLQQLKDATDQLGTAVPEQFRSGLNSVIGVLKALDSTMSGSLSVGSGSPAFSTIQDVASSISYELNQNLGQFGLSFSGGILSLEFALDPATLSSSSLGFSGVSGSVRDVKVKLSFDFSKLADLGNGTFSIANAFSFVVSGEVADVDLMGVLRGTVGFEVSRQIVNVDLDGTPSTIELQGAQLLTFGLSLDEALPTDPETRFLKIGSDGYGLTIQDGTLVAAILSAPAPTSPATDNRRWVAIQAKGFAGSLLLGTFVSASATGIDVLSNSASGVLDADGAPGTTADQTHASALNWTTGIDFHRGTTFHAEPVVVMGQTIDRTTAGTSIAGTLTGLNVLDLLTGSAGFAIDTELVNADLDGDGVADLHAASLVTFGLTDLHLTAGVGDYGLAITAGEIRVAALAPAAPTSGTDSRRWLAVQASGLAGTMTLGTLLTASASAVGVQLNRAGGVLDVNGNQTFASAINWNTAIDLDETATTFGADPVLVLGRPITLAVQLFGISGTLANLNIQDLVSGTVSFEFTKSLVAVDVPGGALAGATLIQLGVTVSSLFVGDPNGVHFTATGGSLAIAALRPAAATGPATDDRSWLAVKGSITGAEFFGVPGLTLQIASLRLEVNRATGAYDADGAGAAASDPAVALDWAHDLSLDGNTVYGEAADHVTINGNTIDFAGALLRAAGTATIKIFEFVKGDVSFTYEQRAIDVDADGDGVFAPGVLTGSAPARGPPDLHSATLTTLGLNIGAGGLTIGIPDGPGLSISSGSLAVAVVTPAAGSTGDSRSWLAVKSSNLTGSLTGIDQVTFAVSGVAVEINRASGAFDPTPDSPASGDERGAAPLNWQLAPVVVPVSDTASLTIDYAGELFHASGAAAVNAFGFVTAVATFDVNKQTVSGADTAGTSFTNAGLLSITLSNASVFVGVGATFDQHGTPLDYSNDTINTANAIGFTASVGSFRFVTIQKLLVTYTAIQIDNLAAGLVGIDDLTFGASGVNVRVNQGPLGTPRLDWNSLVLTAGTLAPLAVDQSDILHAEGSVALSAFGFVAAVAHFSLDKQTVSGADGAGSSFTNADLLAIALTNASVFVGVGSTFDRNATPLDYSDDTIDTAGALGFNAHVDSFRLVTIKKALVVYTGIQIDNLTAGLAGIDDLTFGASGVNVRVNQATPSAARLDWDSLTLTAGTLAPLDIDQSVLLHAEGSAALAAFGFVTAVAHFSLDKQVVSGSDGAGTTFTDADLLAIGLSNASVFVGQGATFDRHGTPLVYSDDTIDTATAIGFSAGVASFRLITIKKLIVTYTAIEIDGFRAGLSGIDGLTFGASGVNVRVNQATPLTPRLDWDSLALTTGTLAPLAIDKSVLLHADGSVALSAFGFVAAVAHFDLDQQIVSGADGAGNTLTDAALFAITLTGAHVFVGVGSTFDDHGTALDYSDDTIDTTNAIGLDASVASFRLVTIRQALVTYNAVQIDNLAGALVGISGFTFSATGVHVRINQATAPANRLDWDSLVLTAGTLATVQIDRTELFHTDGTLSLNAFDLLTGSAHFELAKSEVDVNVPGGTAATMLTIGLSALNLRVGSGAFGVQITSGSVAIASIAANAGDTTRRWVVLQGKDLAATLALPGVTASVSDLVVEINRASGTPLNWTTALDLDRDGTFGDQLTVNAIPIALRAARFSVSGELTNLDVFGLLTGAAKFSVTRQVVDAEVDGTAGFNTAAGHDLVGAALLTFSLDLTGPSRFFDVGTAGFGLRVDDGIVLVAALAPSDPTDPRRWLAVQASGLVATLVLPGVTASVADVAIVVNRASGGAQVIDWTTAIGTYDATAHTFTPMTVSAGGTAITLTDDRLAVSGRITALDILGFVSGTARFELTKSAIALDLNGDGVVDVIGATMLTLSLTELH
ncbi:MAG: hypothetical protein QOE91_1266, partial [Gaiellaceae bacterium]|nr:hypothetical protein [Gaiellaceae bacterium]